MRSAKPGCWAPRSPGRRPPCSESLPIRAWRARPRRSCTPWSSHTLVDGNKCIGLAAALLFYGLNGVEVVATDDELFELTMAVADGRVSEVDAIAKALRSWERPAR